MLGIDAVMIFSAVYKLAFAAVAVAMVMALLRWFDRRIEKRLKAEKNGPFVDAWRRINEHPMAVAVYLGARFLGVCYLVGSMLG